jgi:hypothetical protein
MERFDASLLLDDGESGKPFELDHRLVNEAAFRFRNEDGSYGHIAADPH